MLACSSMPPATHTELPHLRTQATPDGWLFKGERLDTSKGHEGETHPWYTVLWLTGVDYFSTLGYQPGIALLAAGAIAPLATAILIAVTLACALPIYAQVANRSYVGQGSIAMLENLLHGWQGRLLVLALLGFAATDFVITMTLSAADAAQHAVENPLLHPLLGDHKIVITLVLLTLLAAVFLFGFSEAIGLAAFVAIPYLLLNVVVLVKCSAEIFGHPDLLGNWQKALTLKGDWTGLMIASVLIFPRLALGLSGFETGVSVMPLVKGSEADHHDPVPHGRIRNTKKLLAAAAIIMSVLLMLSSFVTTLLLTEADYQAGGKASGRAIAFLAHKYLGVVFGTVYDFSTILILWFAGASAMAGLLHLIPRYLPRLGMAPSWVAYARPLILVMLVVDIIVTIIFKADVEAQGGAYATGVLALMFSAAIAAAISLGREGSKGMSIYCWLVAAVFGYTTAENIHERPDGIIIASIFIFAIVTLSTISRSLRSVELRVSGFTFDSPESAKLWDEISGKKVNLVPVRTATPEARQKKAEEIRRHYRAEGPLAFCNVNLIDNRSEFLTPLRLSLRKEGDNYMLEVYQATAIANTVAYVSELIDPIALFLGLTRLNLVHQALRFLFVGEGETGLMVYAILLKYWEWTPEDDVRPYIYLMSD
jgi:hypothetical protein